MKPITHTLFFVSLTATMCFAGSKDEKTSDHPLTVNEREELSAALQQTLERNPLPSETADRTTSNHSKRGDTFFFLGQFPEAVAEYQAMVKIDPSLDASHWRLGIALFFANQPETAVAQFEKYHSFDDVDRENGIWRYLSQYKARGAKLAKKELLLYEKDDREPFPAVYKLFDGSLTAKAAMDAIPRNLSPPETDKRLFYTELYIGMLEVVKKDNTEAIKYLRRAVSRKWPRDSGFGPNYMWHVARVQLDELTAADGELRDTKALKAPRSKKLD